MTVKERFVLLVYKSVQAHGLIYPDGDGCNFPEFLIGAVENISDDIMEEFSVSLRETQIDEERTKRFLVT